MKASRELCELVRFVSINEKVKSMGFLTSKLHHSISVTLPFIKQYSMLTEKSIYGNVLAVLFALPPPNGTRFM